jgi:uncharacterized protein (TIGR03435 family)
VPSWAGKLRWDVTAKILGTPVQQQNSPDYEVGMQSILSERFGLRTHIEEKILPVFVLVAAKSGVKFHESTAPDAKRGFGLRKPYELTGTGVSLSSFAEMITYDVGRTVIDKTGLHGEYDLNLKWSPDELVENPGDPGVADRPPVIITALRDQLGLKLVPAKGPVKTLVVDFVDMPTEN